MTYGNRNDHCFIADGLDVPAPSDLTVINYRDPSTFRFPASLRTSPRALVLHEACTKTHADTVDVLKKRKLSVHLILDEKGVLHQHVDLNRRTHHCKSLNACSVGVEIVTPYYPTRLGRSNPAPWSTTIDAAPWAHKGRYVVPTLTQLEAVTALTRWLLAQNRIDRYWRGMIGKSTLTMGSLSSARQHCTGIFAHAYLGIHADGAFPALYAWLRLEANLPPEVAMAEAIKRATGRSAAALDGLV